MNAQELHALAPYGATVHFSDGKTQPPGRFKHKLREWQRNNSVGFFQTSSEASPHLRARFGLQLLTSDVMTYTMSFAVDSDLSFTVEPRPAGTLIAYRKWETDGRIEVAHVWSDISVAEQWAERNGYDLRTCSYQYFLVDESDRLTQWTPIGMKPELEKL